MSKQSKGKRQLFTVHLYLKHPVSRFWKQIEQYFLAGDDSLPSSPSQNNNKINSVSNVTSTPNGRRSSLPALSSATPASILESAKLLIKSGGNLNNRKLETDDKCSEEDSFWGSDLEEELEEELKAEDNKAGEDNGGFESFSETETEDEEEELKKKDNKAKKENANT